VIGGAAARALVDEEPSVLALAEDASPPTSTVVQSVTAAASFFT
jgi:hypothetical protein